MSHNDCPGDIGWVSVTTRSSHCPIEVNKTEPIFLYSNKATKDLFQSKGMEITADFGDVKTVGQYC